MAEAAQRLARDPGFRESLAQAVDSISMVRNAERLLATSPAIKEVAGSAARLAPMIASVLDARDQMVRTLRSSPHLRQILLRAIEMQSDFALQGSSRATDDSQPDSDALQHAFAADLAAEQHIVDAASGVAALSDAELEEVLGESELDLHSLTGQHRRYIYFVIAVYTGLQSALVLEPGSALRQLVDDGSLALNVAFLLWTRFIGVDERLFDD